MLPTPLAINRGFILLCSLLITNLIGISKSYSQIPYLLQGTTYDEKMEPLIGVSVTAYTLPDSNLVVFAISDPKGHFKLHLNVSSALIKLTALNYETITYQWNSNEAKELSFRFKLKPTILKEVTIKTPPASIDIKNDTTVFKLNQFSDGTERTLETLLRKIPGFEIDASGQITYQKKVIPQVRLQGEDVFAKNYQLLTRTIHPETIKQVEVIENFSDAPLLVGIEKSGETILNLVVQDAHTGKPFGSVTAQVGTKNRYDAALSLFSVFKAIKFGIVGKANNVGQPLFTPQSDVKPDNSTLRTFNESLEFKPLNRSNLPFLSDLPTERTLFNRSSTIASTVAIPISKAINFHGSGIFTEDQFHWNRSVQTAYLINEQNNTYKEVGSFNQIPRRYNILLKIDAHLSKRATLRMEWNTQNESLDQKDTLQNESPLLIEKVRAQTFARQAIQSIDGRYIYRIGKRYAFDLQIGYTQKTLQENDRYQSHRYDSLFQISQLQQLFQYNITQKRMMASIPFRLKDMYAKVGIGYDLETQQIQSGLFHADMIINNTNHPTQNALERKISNYKGSFTIAYSPLAPLKPSAFNWRSSIEMILYSINDWASISRIRSDQNGTLVNTHTTISYNFSNKITTSLLYSHTENLVSTYTQLPGILFTDYRSFQQGSTFHGNRKNQSVIAALTYKNLNHYYSLSFAGTYFNMNPGYLSHYELSSLFQVSRWVPFHQSVTGYSINTTLNKWLPNWSIKLIPRLAYTHYLSYFAINSESTSVRSIHSISPQLQLESNWQRSFNFSVSASINQYIITGLKQPLTNWSMPFTFKLIYQPDKNIKLYAQLTQVSWKNSPRTTTISMIDFRINWMPNYLKKWNIETFANNLTNVKKIQFTKIDATQQSQQLTFLQPLHVGVSLIRSF